MPVKSQQKITLKGSSEIVTKFFGYAINNVIYQRGIYPEEDFARVKEYGIPLFVAKNADLRNYISGVTEQLEQWMKASEVRRVVLVVMSLDKRETLERWSFDIETSKGGEDGAGNSAKAEKVVREEIQAIMRQITASVTFLPLIEERCGFDVLIYTDKDASVPDAWEESDAKMIPNAREVRLRSFSTKIHKVDTAVAYKEADD
mmetsp:Transcript_15240/g.38460  ORF Transcript_15240/g.38460 Transcript_15240/m.38460 type:complete len:203 (-) Transcript_15240:36-644(-)